MDDIIQIKPGLAMGPEVLIIALENDFTRGGPEMIVNVLDNLPPGVRRQVMWECARRQSTLSKGLLTTLTAYLLMDICDSLGIDQDELLDTLERAAEDH